MPNDLLNKGSKCPIFINDFKRFIGTHPGIKVNFEIMYSLFLFNFDSN